MHGAGVAYPQGRERGQTLVIAVVFFTVIAVSVVLAFSFPLIVETKNVRQLFQSKQALAAAESSLDEIIYRLNHGMHVSLTEHLSVGGASATTTTTNFPPNKKTLVAEGNLNQLIRRVEAGVLLGDGAAFNFGIQSGEGGIRMLNSSSVHGNAYSNGPVTGANQNIIRGDVISAGPSGLADGIHATGTVYAHTISDNDIDQDAYYQVDGGGNTILGEEFPGSPDQSPSELPITDGEIEVWKDVAEAGGIITSPCPYVINSAVTIGPVKINCDLEIRQSSANVTLAGHVWVSGNITFDVGQPIVRLDPALEDNSVIMVADNESNRTTSSKIFLKNATLFENSGTEGSYTVLIAQNNSAENSGSEKAIDVTQSAEGDFLLYAGHGDISLAQSASLREVTAYKITLSNTAEVIYETGLTSLLFTGGPGGGFEITGWQEVE
ncbi:hypothetical protein L0Y40_02825 [Candidatus Wolfebacteria bacterium]|nr:hypothetical protein [Candidatus Wolfebacteria bacterium]